MKERGEPRAAARVIDHARRRAQRGFAYLWTLMAVALLGLGLGVGIEIHQTASQRSKERELLAIGHQFRAAIARYRETRIAGGRQEYPMSLDDLIQDRRFPGQRRYLRKVFVDPMTGKTEWGLVRVAGRIVGVHSLSQQQPIKLGNFEAEDASLRGKQHYSEWVFTYPADVLLRPAGDGRSPGAFDAAPAPPPSAPPGLVPSSQPATLPTTPQPFSR